VLYTKLKLLKVPGHDRRTFGPSFRILNVGGSGTAIVMLLIEKLLATSVKPLETPLYERKLNQLIGKPFVSSVPVRE
jgi:hypothetical protein